MYIKIVCLISQVPHSHIPFGPDGSGFYSDNTKGCYLVIQEALPLIATALDEIGVANPNETFCIADYGTADGGTSSPVIINCIEKLRAKYGNDLPINVVYEDQPTNDFKSIFLRVNGILSSIIVICDLFNRNFTKAFEIFEN